jgi:hypothetical protein
MQEDAWGGSPSLDRNLYLESTTYNGAVVPGGSLFLNRADPRTFTFTDSGAVDPPVGGTTPTNTTIGSGPDSLVLQISQDQYQGPATYTIKVDGVQIGGVLTAHAEHANPVQDVVTVKGDWGNGGHTVEVRMLEDAWGGSAALDRNLYVESSTYNGATVPGGSLVLNTNNPQTFTFTDTGANAAAFSAASPSSSSMIMDLVSDTGSSSSDNITSNPAVKGRGEANTGVTILDGGALLGTTMTDIAGAWSFTPTGLADGMHTLTATDADLAGNTGSASLSFTLDTLNLTGVA